MAHKRKKATRLDGKRARNPLAIHALNRKAGPMHDRRIDRGGNRNIQRDLREEA